MPSDNDIGFGGSSQKSKIAVDVQGFAPKPLERNSIPEARNVDDIADRHQFVSREGVKRVERPKASEPSDNLYVRGPLSVINKFKEISIARRMSYHELLAELLKGYD